MTQVRLDSDVEELVREWADEHDCSLSSAVNGMLREWEDMTFVDTPQLPTARASVRSARGTLRPRPLHAR